MPDCLEPGVSRPSEGGFASPNLAESDARIPILVPLDPGLPLGQAPDMDALPPPLAFFILLFAGWVNRQQQAVIDYLVEENRVLLAERAGRRLRLTDDQRRRLAVK